jgi:fatty-acyl-CoA synthase
MTRHNQDPDLLRLGMTVSDLQLSALRRYPDATALVCEGRRYTYREVEHYISRFAQYFDSLGLGRGQGLAMLAANLPEVIFANWAAQSLGIRYTALHPKGSEEDHLYILEQAQITALVVDGQTFTERGRALQSRSKVQHVLVLRGDFGIDLNAAVTKFAPAPVIVKARPGDVCNIYFTGGTTGRPKGAAHTHTTMNGITVQSLAFWDWPSTIRFLIATPISHAAGGMLTPTLIRGGEFHILSGFHPDEFLKTVERERITATFLVPSMIYDLLDKVPIEKYDLSSLEMIIYGASPISPSRLKEAIERIGPRFCQLYGQTEAPNLIAYLSKADHDLTRPHLLASCGVPLAPNMIKLLKEDGTEAGLGEAGEICIRGQIVMKEYWNSSDETEKALQGDWLHTGDVAKRDEQGYLYIVDRVKDMVISGGFNIFTREVEDCIALHPAIAAVAVIGIPHPRWGEAVAAFVTLKPGATVGADELIALVKERKGAVQAPKILKFLDRMPMTAIGKVDKKNLRAEYWPVGERSVS